MFLEDWFAGPEPQEPEWPEWFKARKAPLAVASVEGGWIKNSYVVIPQPGPINWPPESD